MRVEALVVVQVTIQISLCLCRVGLIRRVPIYIGTTVVFVALVISSCVRTVLIPVAPTQQLNRAASERQSKMQGRLEQMKNTYMQIQQNSENNEAEETLC